MTDSQNLNRVRWRCRRGTLELDTILGGFFRHRYTGLSVAEQADFERLLAQPDHLLGAWLEQGLPAPDDLREIVSKIRWASG